MSRVTVREAIQSLEQFGVIEVRRGSQGGAYIKKMDLNDILPQIRNAMKMTNLTLKQVTEARAVLEEAILRRLILSKVSKENVTSLSNSIALAEAYLKNEKAKRRILDYFHFHTMIAEVTGNPIIN